MPPLLMLAELGLLLIETAGLDFFRPGFTVTEEPAVHVRPSFMYTASTCSVCGSVWTFFTFSPFMTPLWSSTRGGSHVEPTLTSFSLPDAYWTLAVQIDDSSSYISAG